MKLFSLLLIVLIALCAVSCQTSEDESNRTFVINPGMPHHEVVTMHYARQFGLEDIWDQLYILHHFGTFNDAEILIIASGSDGVLSIGQAIWYEEVGGLVFTDNIWLPIIVYYNGIFLSLSLAYIDGIIDLAVLQTVHAAHMPAVPLTE